MTVRLEVVAAEAWADRVADELIARVNERPALRLCLPSGDTPSKLFSRLVARSAAGEVTFAGVTIVLLDEFLGLAAGDPARCDVRLNRDLLAGLYLALLGLGMNGHVGLNEPGSDPDSPTRVVGTAAATQDAALGRYGAGRAPVMGITLGMDRLLAAGEVWLLVTGSRKADILARALNGPEGDDCPASFLRRHPRLWVVADEGAAARL
jgi:6-phosphogluconolactonase/glucosamine-6-phosphate isomerase/deaminase